MVDFMRKILNNEKFHLSPLNVSSVTRIEVLSMEEIPAILGRLAGVIAPYPTADEAIRHVVTPITVHVSLNH
jgi:hypothetical protein